MPKKFAPKENPVPEPLPEPQPEPEGPPALVDTWTLAGFARFRVKSGITAISNGEKAYPVADGEVFLPVGETWYYHLCENGTLTA
jgi:hypothetical protein